MQGAGPGFLVLCLAKCLLEIAIFEVDASLKWMPWQSKLVRHLHSKKKKKKQKQKPQLSGLHYNLEWYWCPEKRYQSTLLRPESFLAGLAVSKFLPVWLGRSFQL